MKVRQGFVSNSSSSSFILKGFEVPENIIEDLNQKYEEGLYEYLDNKNFDLQDPWDGGAPEGTYLIGKKLAVIDESGYIPLTVIDINKDNDIEDLKNEFGINTDTKIYVGTEMC